MTILLMKRLPRGALRLVLEVVVRLLFVELDAVLFGRERELWLDGRRTETFGALLESSLEQYLKTR